MSVPAISVCMTTARPFAWRRTYENWLAFTKYPDRVEFVIYFAEWYGFDPEHPPDCEGHPVMVWSDGPSTSISGWNAAAAASSGRLLLMAHDDICPPKDWDAELRQALPSLREEFVFVLETSPEKWEDTDYDMAGLTRARFRKLGYVFYPQYEGAGELQEFYMHGEMDGVVEPSPPLRFRHYHPKYGDARWDEVYESRNSEHARQNARGLFKSREMRGFPPEAFKEGFDLSQGETTDPVDGFLHGAGLPSS